MKIPTALKKAVLEQDWKIVCKVYERLTGEKLETPKPKTEAEEISEIDIDIDIEEDHETLSAELDKAAEEIKKEDLGPKKPAKPVPLSTKTRTNKFKDNQTLFTEESVKINPKLGVQRKDREIERETTAKIWVKCSCCNQKFQISPNLAFGYDKDDDENTWKCNDCCTPSGQVKTRRSQLNV